MLERLADKYGVTAEHAEAMEARVRTAAHDEGLVYDGERLHGSTFDVHRILHFALDSGRQLELIDLVFAAHFGGTANVFDHEVLLDLAAEAGLDRDEAAAVLVGDEYADAVRADEALASELGVSGVPFFVVGARYAVSGGQDPAVFTDVLQQRLGRARRSHGLRLTAELERTRRLDPAPVLCRARSHESVTPPDAVNRTGRGSVDQ